MKLKDIQKEKCITHTYVLKDDKYNITYFVKSIMLPKSLADLLIFIKKREIKINDIGRWIMSKSPFIINFDFSESALNQKSGFIYVIGDISESDLLKVKLQIIDILKIKFKRVLNDKEKITTEDDINIFNNLIDELFECKLELKNIEKTELQDSKLMYNVWSSYLVYLLTKEKILLEVDYSVNKKLNTIIKELKSKGVSEDYSNKNISEIPINHIKISSPKECYDVEIEELEDRTKSNCTYKIKEVVELEFKLRNSGSALEAMSNTIYVDNKPFSFILSIGIDDLLTDDFLINLFISSTSWVNESFDENSKLSLKTKDKLSLYICPNEASNYYTRLEILNKSDENTMYNKFLSKLDSNILSKMTNNQVQLSDILKNTTKFLDCKRLEKGEPFIGIPVSASIRAESKNAQLSGVAIKDKESFYKSVYEILSKSIKLDIAKELPIVKDNMVDTFEAKNKLIDIDKLAINNTNLEEIKICYWTDTQDNFNRFKDFIEKLKTKHSKKNPERPVFKPLDNKNIYNLELENRNIKISLLKMNSIELTELIESSGKYPNKNDKRIRVSKNKQIIEKEYSRYNGIDFSTNDKSYTINILDIDDYHNQYNISKYDPSDTIKQAFLEMNHSVQRINQVCVINRRINESKAKQNTKLIDKLRKELDIDKIGNIYKSALMDTFSKKGITVQINDEELFNGSKEIYGFMTEIIGKNKVYLMSKINKDGYFIKDISKIQENESRRSRRVNKNTTIDSNDWIPMHRFTEIAQKYIQRIKTNTIEESEIWSIIEKNIDNTNINSKKILFISAAERKHMISLRNNNMSDNIKILKNIDNMAIVRVNEMNKEIPFAAIYKIDSTDKENLQWVASNNQGLCMKNYNLYYDIGKRGDTLQTPLTTSKLLPQSKPIARRKAIEFYIASNNKDLFEESAVIASGLRKINVAFDASTNLPMPLFMLKNISNELNFLFKYDEEIQSDIDLLDEDDEIVSMDDSLKKIESSIQVTFFDIC